MTDRDDLFFFKVFSVLVTGVVFIVLWGIQNWQEPCPSGRWVEENVPCAYTVVIGNIGHCRPGVLRRCLGATEPTP